MSRWINRLLQFLDNLLVKIYSTPSQPIRTIFLRPIYEIRRGYQFLTHGLTFEIIAIEGQAKGVDQKLKVIYFSEGKGQSFLVSQLFEQGTVEQRKIKNIRVWQINQAIKSLTTDVDFVIIEENALLHWRPSFGIWSSTPTWVRMVLDLNPNCSWEEMEATFRKHERNIRRFKRSSYHYEISREPDDFHYFYDHMYVPFIHGRHPGYGMVDSKSHLYSLFQNGFLLFIVDANGKRVAGDLAAIYGDVYFGIVSGVLENDETLLEAGAVSALYYYAIQWCHEHHIRRCDIGEARPFENDGLYKFKRRWGYQPMKELWNTHEWVFWVPGDSPLAIDWLHSHPTLAAFTEQAQGDPTQTMEYSLKQSPGTETDAF